MMWTEGDLGLSLHSPQRSLQSQAVRQRKRPCAQKESSAVCGSERSIWKHCWESRKTGSRGTHPGPIFTQEMMEPAESRL